MGKTIKKKILPKYFDEVLRGNKTFELRKDENRVQVGDTLLLYKYDDEYGYYDDTPIEKKVTYVLRNCSQYGLMDGYCIIGFSND